MKILIINAYENLGGASRAALRLHNALIGENIDCTMLVQQKSSKNIKVITKEGLLNKGLSQIRPTLDLIPTRFYKNKDSIMFSPSMLPFSGMVEKINEINPDIVHFHWICGGMIKIEDIAKITAPIVWSLHDSWAFTGGCHLKLECEKYKESCGACPRLNSNNKNDLSKKVWKRKNKIFSLIPSLTIVGLSNWLNNDSKQSSLFKNRHHQRLPNPINCHVFKNSGKIRSRELWNLPINKKIILFGAMNPNDKVKGFQQLIGAIGKISTENIEIVVFGNSNQVENFNSKAKVHFVGHLHDDISMVTLYSAADVTIVPSIEENLSNVIMESMSCATPVVGFNIGGNSDLIEHKKTGYLVDKVSSEDLALGIDWVLQNNEDCKISSNARKKVLSEFESSVVAKKYIALYKKILLIN